VDAGRWSVQIEGSDERMRVKPSCIKLVSAKQLQALAYEVFEAARSGHAGPLSKLLASSPAVAWGDISDGGTGTTVLAVAAKGGHDKCVALLLNCEGKPNIRAADSFGQAAVHCAAESGSVEALRLLLDAGADPCSPDAQGQTPLHFAAEEGRVECARVLLHAGASASAVYRGATPYQWALNGGHSECAELLKGE
jgi:ankyrin repeat protein